MTCKKCGATVPENEKFCTECGTYVGDSSPKAQYKLFAVLAAVVAVPLLILALINSGSGDSGRASSNTSQTASGSAKESGSQSSSSSGSAKESSSQSSSSSAGTKESDSASTASRTATPEPAKTPSSFSIANSQGERMEVEPGFSYVSCVKALTDTSDRAVSILIPPIFDYTDVEYSMGGESVGSNGTYTLTFSTKDDDMDFIENYINDLSKYGITLERRWVVTEGIATNQIAYHLNISGNVTHGLLDFLSQL